MANYHKKLVSVQDFNPEVATLVNLKKHIRFDGEVGPDGMDIVPTPAHLADMIASLGIFDSEFNKSRAIRFSNGITMTRTAAVYLVIFLFKFLFEFYALLFLYDSPEFLSYFTIVSHCFGIPPFIVFVFNGVWYFWTLLIYATFALVPLDTLRQRGEFAWMYIFDYLTKPLAMTYSFSAVTHNPNNTAGLTRKNALKFAQWTIWGIIFAKWNIQGVAIVLTARTVVSSLIGCNVSWFWWVTVTLPWGIFYFIYALVSVGTFFFANIEFGLFIGYNYLRFNQINEKLIAVTKDADRRRGGFNTNFERLILPQRIASLLYEINDTQLRLHQSFTWWQRYVTFTLMSTSALSIFLLYTAVFSDAIPLVLRLIFVFLTFSALAHNGLNTCLANVLNNECHRMNTNIIKLSVVLGMMRKRKIGYAGEAGSMRASPQISRSNSEEPAGRTAIQEVRMWIDREVARGTYEFGCSSHGMYHMTNETLLVVLLEVACYFLLVAASA